MFKSNEKETPINKIETLIGEGCSIIGSLKGDDLLKVDGYVEGNITWQNDIIFGSTGYCKGNIYCKVAYINGKIDGNINCEETLCIESYGKITGDINVKNIIIKDGGIFQGNCSIRNTDDFNSLE